MDISQCGMRRCFGRKTLFIMNSYLRYRAEDFLRVAKLASGNLSQSQNTFAKKHALQRHSVS